MALFQQQGSFQANASPLQKYVKKVGLGQKTDNPFLRMRGDSPRLGRWKSPMTQITAKYQPFLDPVFMFLVDQGDRNKNAY